MLSTIVAYKGSSLFSAGPSPLSKMNAQHLAMLQKCGCALAQSCMFDLYTTERRTIVPTQLQDTITAKGTEKQHSCHWYIQLKALSFAPVQAGAGPLG